MSGLDYDTSVISNLLQENPLSNAAEDFFLVTVPDNYIVFSDNDPTTSQNQVLSDYLFPNATTDAT